MARQVLYRNERYMFTVSEEDGQLVLESLCGGPGLYLVEHWLDDAETVTFQSAPEALAPLALSLCKQGFGRPRKT